ncbi:MAG: hypothetical protein WD013_02410 [Gemmatimonadota bacterium]
MNRGGMTLLELALVLGLMGAATAVLLPPVRHQADLLAVRGAREELIGLVRQARSQARAFGEARIVLTEGSDAVLVPPSGRPPRRVDLARRGIRLEVQGTRSSVALRFGPLGVARWGSASFVLRKRRAELPVVVSSYGRIRR